MCAVPTPPRPFLCLVDMNRGPEALESTGLRRCRSAVIEQFKPIYIDEEREKEKRRFNGGGGKRRGAQPHEPLPGLPLALAPSLSPSSALSSLPSAPPSSPAAADAASSPTGVAAKAMSLGGGGGEEGEGGVPPSSNGSLANGDHAGGGGDGAHEVSEAFFIFFRVEFGLMLKEPPQGCGRC